MFIKKPAVLPSNLQTLRPRLLDSLYIHTCDERILYLNPALPDWIAINRKYKGIFDRFDGAQTVSEILKYIDTAFFDDDYELLNSQVIKILNNIKIFDHSRVIVPRRNSYTPTPRYIYLTLTDDCNLNCSYCYTKDRQTVHNGSPLSLSFLQWKDFIDQVLTYSDGPVDFNFTGGEPLLVPYLFELAEYIRNRGSRSVLLTNGMLIQDEAIAIRIAANFQQVRLSLDSIDEEINSQLRGVGVVDRVKNAFFLLEQHGADVTVVSTVTELNKTELQSFVEAFNSKVSFQPLYKIGAGRESPHPLSGETYFESLSAANIIKRLPSYYRNIHHYRNNPYKRCALAAEELSIGPNGDLFPCHLLHYNKLKAGNLLHDNFKNLYENSAILQEIRKINIDTLEQCHICPVRNFCGAGCRARIDYLKEGLTGKDEFCVYEKKLILDALLNSYS